MGDSIYNGNGLGNMFARQGIVEHKSPYAKSTFTKDGAILSDSEVRNIMNQSNPINNIPQTNVMQIDPSFQSAPKSSTPYLSGNNLVKADGSPMTLAEQNTWGENNPEAAASAGNKGWIATGGEQPKTPDTHYMQTIGDAVSIGGGIMSGIATADNLWGSGAKMRSKYMRNLDQQYNTNAYELDSLKKRRAAATAAFAHQA